METRRLRIVDAAMTLFSERGFDNVSTAEVAAAAGVTEKTVFNHFGRKEDIVFYRSDSMIQVMEQTIRDRHQHPGVPIIELLRELTHRQIDLRDNISDELRKFTAITAASPTLERRRLLALNSDAELVRDALLEEKPELGAGGLATALGYILASIHWATLTELGNAVTRGVSIDAACATAHAAVDRGYEILRSGFGSSTIEDL
ncbi:MAG: helix-turn-helix domain-containing protein [Microbacterium sp.]|uniref:TetR/AcrR family transcriptional regulator n=1 Tax=Microbacterium sp. TaxID=51671 RepID=UPI0039E5924D